MTAGAFLVAVLAALVAIAFLVRAYRTEIVFAPNVGLLYRDGRFARELPPGRHSWFDPLRRTRVVTVALVETPVALGEFTVLSRDRFSFRLGLAPTVRITDARAYSESQVSFEDQFGQYLPFAPAHAALHPLVSAAALAAAGDATLDEIVAAPAAIEAALQVRLADALPGAQVVQVLVTAINLPPETRRMFTDVERARKEAEVALERARGEQAALRVLANAARLVKDNPALANLRLLQAVESSKGATTIVIGNPAAPLPGLGGAVESAG